MPPQEQLVAWIRDWFAPCDGASARVDEQLCILALEEPRMLFEEYPRRFPIPGADDLGQ